MRHRKEGNRLSRNQALRTATLRDMARAVLIQERICTTSAKAKEARKLIEHLITLGKKDTLAARRRAFAILCDHGLVSRLFKETAPRFKSRAGGYTRIIPFQNRMGDNAKLAFLELTEKSREIVTGQKVERTKSDAQAETVTDAEVKPTAEKPGAETKKKSTKAKEAKPAGEGHSKADVKTSTKAAAKPTGIKKLFQRKTGGE